MATKLRLFLGFVLQAGFTIAHEAAVTRHIG
jgi:hypothetical protein